MVRSRVNGDARPPFTRDGPVDDQQGRGSVGFTPGQMSGVFGAIEPAPGVTTTVPVAGGATMTPVRGLAWGYSIGSGNAVAGLR